MSVVFHGFSMNSPHPKRLAQFYIDVFGVKEIPQASDDEIRRLITAGDSGTGSVMTIRKSERESRALRVNELGFAHLCFEADNVAEVIRRMLTHGGSILSTFEDWSKCNVVYANDPDGNVLEVHLPLPSPFTLRTVVRTVRSLLSNRFGLFSQSNRHCRFLHINIVSPSWEKTVGFYQSAFNAKAVGLKRHYQGDFIAQLTRVKSAVVCGRHVALPSYSHGGPTLEIFSYNNVFEGDVRLDGDTGIAVVEFTAQDISAVSARIVRAGGVMMVVESTGSWLFKDIDGNRIRLFAAA